jgi:light-regulated signal transduction histidine kinase (bacteriophytochrome)
MINEVSDYKNLFDKADKQLAILNEKLSDKNVELKKAHEELNYFAYTAAHDLVAPFRAIVTYLTLIKNKFSDKPADPDIQEYFEKIKGLKDRITTLLDDLLEFTKIDRTKDIFGKVDMQKIIGEVLENISTTIHSTNTNVIIQGEMPIIKGYQSLIFQLLLNLISNAIKFQDKVNPEIIISVENGRSLYTFSVKDNGIGIDPKYNTIIFEPFQRLHSQHEFPGTGLGLSICKRIVEKHGGRIWVESKLKEGITFKFTLPKIVEKSAKQKQIYKN